MHNKPHSQKTKILLSKRTKDFMKNNPNVVGFKFGHKINIGRTYTDERNEQIRLSKLGKKRDDFSPQWRQNMAEALHKSHESFVFGFQKGKDNPSWSGGQSAIYGAGFTGFLKRKIKERDGHECQLCKTHNNLAIHHIDYNKENCEKNNLITLCRSCNVKVNFGREKWQKLFKSRILVVSL